MTALENHDAQESCKRIQNSMFGFNEVRAWKNPSFISRILNGFEPDTPQNRENLLRTFKWVTPVFELSNIVTIQGESERSAAHATANSDFHETQDYLNKLRELYSIAEL
eukprot:TRINITY_DN22163_c0_g1_i1.p1 TRINITY_DN22163_c0_g1~~TRINITY_DN22163_c0_g1_i1.p1  ORF type:complete len:109 (-),score=16.33 TRINITY_DN22163_c0_g1_i1:318-644(-)